MNQNIDNGITDRQLNCLFKQLHHIHDRSQSYDICLHHWNHSLCLKCWLSNNWRASHSYCTPSLTLNNCQFFRDLISIHFQIGIGRWINIKNLWWIKNQSICSCWFQISIYSFECKLMDLLGSKHVTGHAVYCTSDISVCMSRQIWQHSNHAAIAEVVTQSFSIFILLHWSWFMMCCLSSVRDNVLASNILFDDILMTTVSLTWLQVS